PQCGLVNYSNASTCRRCGTAIDGTVEVAVEVVAEDAAPPAPSRRLIKGAAQILAVVGGLLLIAHFSLTLTSNPLSSDQRQIVNRAIDVLDQQGFGGDA